jgi:hypothetical protein
MPEDEVVAVIGVETSQGASSPTARPAYGGFQCNACRRICGSVDSDGRCHACGPIPVEKPELSEPERFAADMQREQRMIEQRKRDHAQ